MKKIRMTCFLLVGFLFVGCIKNPDQCENILTVATVAGRVLPLGIGAAVKTIQGGNTKSVPCDSGGYFLIGGLKPGACVLAMRAKNYGTSQITVSLLGGDNEVRDILLQPLPYPVTGVSPTIQSQWNSLSSIVMISFALPMDTGTTNKAFGVSPSVDGVIVWSSDFMQLQFRPNTVLLPATTYTVTIDSSARSLDSQRIEFAMNLSFATEPFRVSSASPSIGTANVSSRQQIYFTFNTAPDFSSIQKGLSIQPPLYLEYSWQGSNSIYVEPAIGFWKCNTKYVITINTTAEDIIGQALPQPYTYTFYTQSVRVVSPHSFPSYGQVAVSRSPSIEIEFNTLMDSAQTVNAFRLTKDQDSAAIPWTVSLDNINLQFTFTPTQLLDQLTTYVITVDTSAADLFESKMPISWSSIFTTGM